MGFEEAFNVVPKGKEKETTMEVNSNAFTVAGKLEPSASEKVTYLQGRLNEMQGKMKKDLEGDEFKVAWLAIERELEQIRVPKKIEDIMRNESLSRSDAIDKALADINDDVNKFIDERLAKVIQTVDAESWTDTVSKEEAGEILKDLEKSRGVKDSQQLAIEAEAFKQRYQPRGRSHIQQVDDAAGMR